MMVTAPGNEIREEDIPEEFGGIASNQVASNNWTAALAQWANQQFDAENAQPLLDQAQPEFERILILTALQRARGRKQDAARLLGWGRNTLTRKIKELNIDSPTTNR
jgi:two-component system nitrogen regulation response regulator GlnG